MRRLVACECVAEKATRFEPTHQYVKGNTNAVM